MTRDEEIAEKERRVRQLLENKGLKALLFKRHANFSWMTGGGLNLVGIATDLGGTSLLITRNAKYVLANNIEAPRMLQEEEVEKQGYILQTFPWHTDREGALVRELAGEGRIGCDVSYPDTLAMAEEIAQLRYALTPAEQERYRRLGETASRAVEKTLLDAQAGEKESEVVGRLCAELWKHRIDPVGLMAAADDRISRFRHPIPTERRVERFLMLSVNARKGGLVVCLTRFVHFGKVPVPLREQYEENVFVDCTLMAHTRPGVPAREVLEKGLEAYRDRGFPEEWTLHHQGGAIGYQPRDYRVTPTTPDVVLEGQAFCWNPTITGTKSEDTILAMARGPEMITPPVLYPSLSLEVAGTRFTRPAILEKG
jgi:Xaa-Pro aminopeptidase